MLTPPPDLLLKPIVELALREDLRSGDATTAALIEPGTAARAHMVWREAAVVCGLPVAALAFRLLQPDAEIHFLLQEGQGVEADQAALDVAADASTVLSAERVALNFVQRMSGIATLTRRFVEAVADTGAAITDTRKTTPGLRLLEKYAVRCGGGANHRFALDDLILIKDNHIALCGGIAPAIQRARDYAGHSLKIEVECDTLEQVEEAAARGADIILLDNMHPLEMAEAIAIIDGLAEGRQILTEASGNISLETVRAVAESGVDLISSGALTHSARVMDVGLDVAI